MCQDSLKVINDLSLTTDVPTYEVETASHIETESAKHLLETSAWLASP